MITLQNNAHVIRASLVEVEDEDNPIGRGVVLASWDNAGQIEYATWRIYQNPATDGSLWFCEAGVYFTDAEKAFAYYQNRIGASSRDLPNAEEIDAFISRFPSTTEAVLAVSRQAGVAVAWIDRAVVEEHLGRPLTPEEWTELAIHFDSEYDEWVGADDTQSEFLDHALADVGITNEQETGDQ